MDTEPVEPKPFRLQHKFLALTYKTHIEKNKFKEWLCKFTHEHGTTVLCCEIAHESGLDDPETPYLHTHVAIEWKERICILNATRVFDWLILFDCEIENCTHIGNPDCKYGEIDQNIHPYIGLRGGKMIKNRKMFNDYLRYLGKEDPECSHLLNKTASAFDRVSDCNNVQEALQLCTKFSDATGVIAMFNMINNKPVLDDLEGWKPWGWQIPVLHVFESHPDERTILWFWREMGKVGKTKFCRWLMYTNPEFFLVIQGLSFIRDTVQVIKNAVDRGWNGYCILINLPRKFEHSTFIYETMEALKDGINTTQKYSGMTFLTRHPHIIIFANWPPKFYDTDGSANISIDRFIVEEIKEIGIDPNGDTIFTSPLPKFNY